MLEPFHGSSRLEHGLISRHIDRENEFVVFKLNNKKVQRELLRSQQWSKPCPIR